MYLSKRKVILVISISILVFFFTYTDVKSQDVKITDGDTIKINGEKIRFSGIDTPELKQTCIKQGARKPCGLTAKKILVDKIAENKIVCIREGKDQYKRTLAECFVNNESLSKYRLTENRFFSLPEVLFPVLESAKMHCRAQFGNFGESIIELDAILPNKKIVKCSKFKNN